MTEPAAHTHQPTASRWHNHLPPWIIVDPPFQQLAGSVRHTLQTIADKCDAPDGRGDLLGALGGDALHKACGVCRATLWNHVRRLLDLGYVLKLPGNGLANCYAIPGDRRAPLPAPAPKLTQNHTIARPDFRRLGAQNLGATIHGYPPGIKPSGPGLGGFSKKRGTERITVAQLRDDASVFGLHASYVARGLIDNSEAGEQHVFEAAENALRHGKAPGALFWTRILDYHQRKLPFAVSNEVADRARARWKRAKRGEAARPLTAQEPIQKAEILP